MKSKKILACILAAMLTMSAVSIPVFAAEDSVDNVNIAQENSDREVIDGTLVSNPSYLGVMPKDDKVPDTTRDLSNAIYEYSGRVNGPNKSVYTNYMFTGKYTYYIDIKVSGGGPMKYQIINQTSNNKVMQEGTVKAGEKVNITAGGFSLTSRMYIKFTSGSTNSGWTSASGIIS